MTRFPEDLPAGTTPPGRDAASERTLVARAAAPGRAADPRPARGTSSSPEPRLPGRGTEAREGEPGVVLRTGAGLPLASDPARGSLSPAEPLAGTTWTVDLPAGLKLLSLNDRLHWAQSNRIYQSLKKAAWAMTINARVPHLERVAVEAVYDPPDRRHRDPDNLAPSLKACLDGIVASGRVIPADDSRYVASTACSIGEVYPRGRLRLIIREVSARAGVA